MLNFGLMKNMALETDIAMELEIFRKRCLELEEKSKKNGNRLETEVENLKKKNQELEGKIAMIQKVIVDTTCMENYNENLHDLMVENKVLECEKIKAETDLSFWKEKAKELESNIKVMNEKVKEDSNVILKGSKEAFHSQVRRRCPFCPKTQSTFHGIIDINDEDVKISTLKKVSGSSKCDGSAKSQRSSTNNLDDFRVHSSSTRSAKRKRGAKIIAGDDENIYDDNAPICTLKTQHSQVRRRCPLCPNNKQDESVIDLNKMVSSSEDEEDNDGVESEGQSLAGFIVESSETPSRCDSEGGDSTDESEDALYEYKKSLEKIGRKRVLNLKWDMEGDMLSDFGKDPELCMRAVCALYRQQTADERTSKVTIHQNKRGFSQADALRASKLAEFLTDGDPNGNLNRTVEELKAYDSKGIKQCRKLASQYSKQLFNIYQNKEDPYFLPR